MSRNKRRSFLVDEDNFFENDSFGFENPDDSTNLKKIRKNSGLED